MPDRAEYTDAERQRMAAAAAITELLHFLRTGSERLRHAPDEMLRSVVCISGADPETVSAFERRNEDKAAWNRAQQKIGDLAVSGFERIDAGEEVDDAADLAGWEPIWLDRVDAMRRLGGIPKHVPAGFLIGWLSSALDGRPDDNKLLLAGEKPDAPRAAKDARTVVLSRISRRFADAMEQDKGPPQLTAGMIWEDGGIDADDLDTMSERAFDRLKRETHKIMKKWA